ncbi:hypothetical protein PHLGIDRAFT_104486 [Phlebiopsis gigantea 11061_1 CR5-6]|uniref:F-box/LRR-repeat protein 15-like leucin rich repeat domain-containing protein n=1 Tax=Phlebiopsis gigantea (strain 11061_1 CR5-6) TaxID=745531 RepID=A0A0C3S0F6_PHLG1|nr:hypothetical protein PHLGIDRAFT_104486 [Phlebiopsis gigantea 11061_1 CR5-6]
MHLFNALPQTTDEAEALEVLELTSRSGIVDDDLAEVLPYCPNLREARLRGVRDLSDRTLGLLGAETDELRVLDAVRCRALGPAGVRALAAGATRLRVLRLGGVWALTDGAVVQAVQGLGHLTELNLADLPLLTAHSVREIWMFSRNLRRVDLSDCVNVTDRGFPAPCVYEPPPSRPRSRIGERLATPISLLPPLILPAHHIIPHLHYISLKNMALITDDAVIGLLQHVPRVIELELGGCTTLTDRIVPSLCSAHESLELIDLAHLTHLSDAAVFSLVRACNKLRHVDISYCTRLTDLPILELAQLPGLRRLHMNGLRRATDIGLLALAEQAHSLAHLHLASCKRLSLDALHTVLRRLPQLQRFTSTGVPAMARAGGWDPQTQGAYGVFKDANISALRAFLDKEVVRQREAERRCIPFVPRADDSMDLY